MFYTKNYQNILVNWNKVDIYVSNLVIFLCHQPLEVREHKSSPHKVAVLGVWAKIRAQGEAITELATALESGRYESVWNFYMVKDFGLTRCLLWSIVYKDQ